MSDEMDKKSQRWLFVSIASVIAVCILGCVAAWIAHPREWACVMNEDSNKVMECIDRGSLR